MTHILLKPIGIVRTEAATVPRHWTVSDVEGTLVIDEAYRDGLKDIRPGQKIIVLFHFHKSQPFSPHDLIQKPPHRNEHLGVFSICSPRRPNPIGLSVVEVLDVQGCTLRVKGIDMFDGTPILDLKPWITPDS
ncbi:tRNA (N6-threonylcarbamoyladenosine(37)-N6)-methyltransferase TrmO [Desulfosoma caldarium]|uniref:tRNA-Thr(GGU) m(6)t(6)A37 methyltransferase TsaA n=1 Tax=Desulfosoma caldarium TaxID=610254 RepID=A0A3N1ULI2_9BACT|nr:tRNA (N6-threonylcarbamoyladenosine(37)-N6)-methyltransferase TrmO [Desulfosoma caldarium]ROQ92085.1 tRNA-Thr(GGU) m(6)t(6)A37 methyltransferase TsaA [Desulfosoma caldarium]